MASERNTLNSAPQSIPQPMGTVRTGNLPPLPPRPPQLSMSLPNRPTLGMSPSLYGGYSGGYSGYSGGYSGYGYSSYAGYPGNMYLPGGYGCGSYGQSNGTFDNRFVQAAEESSRNHFQSIESLVRAFSSISMMLESTYHAMYSSFRAILGVIDNFSRLRELFAQFLSAITVLRIMKSFYHRLLHWLGIIDHRPPTERIWERVSVQPNDNSQVRNNCSWPLFTFIGLLFGGPYLISKFFASNIVDSKKWDLSKGKFYKTSYPHQAASNAELSFKENEIINVAPQELQLQDGNGWLLAINQQGQTGYVPVTRLGSQFNMTNQQKPQNTTS